MSVTINSNIRPGIKIIGKGYLIVRLAVKFKIIAFSIFQNSVGSLLLNQSIQLINSQNS